MWKFGCLGVAMWLLLSSCTHVRFVTDSDATGHDAPVAEVSPVAKRSLERGKKLAAQRRFLEAIDAFEAAIASDPGSIEAHEALATTLATVGRTDEALQVLGAAEARFPNEPRFVFLEGRIHLQAGRTDEAESAFEETLRIAPDHALALLNLGMIEMYRDGETEAARRAFERVTALMPEDPKGYRFLGEAHLRLGHLDAAVTALQEALRRDPRNVDAHILLGAAYVRQEKLDAAAIEFREAIRVDPENIDARFRLGFVLQQQGRFEEALAAYEAVLARAPDFLLVHLLEANIYVHQEAYEKVLESLVAVMVRDFERTFTGAAEGSGEKGAAMKPATGRFPSLPDAEEIRNETQAELSRRLEAHADSPAAHILLALVAVDRGEPEVARFECRRALELDAHDPYAHFVMGLLYLNGNEPDKALASFVASTEGHPSFVPGNLLQGWVEEYRGNLDGAIAAYEKVARPERPHITLHLGNLLLRRGAYERAGERFRSLLSRYPDHPAAQRGEALAAFGKAHDGRAYWLIRKVFAANPADALACYILGTLEIERGEKTEGVSTLARCLSIESKEAIDFDFIFRDVRNRKEVYAALVEAGGKAAQPGKALLTVAQILSDQEETDSALGIYDELLRKLPDNPALHTLRGNLLLRSHRLDEARRAYERALELDPTFAWALRGLGWTAFQAHDFKKAEEAFRKALEIKNDPVAWNGLGEALRSQGRYEEARRAYLQAIGEAPDFRPPYLNLARMNREEGYFVEAIETYQAYLDRYPGDREARFQLGLAYFYAQRHREAARTWQALLEVEHPREDYLEIFTYFALQYSGDSEAADRLIRKKLEKLNHSDWPASVFAFLGRRISEEELVAAARDADERKTLENLCEAYYYLGAWYRSVRQDPKTARRYFELAVETKVTDFIEYRLARIALGLEGE